MKFNLEKAKSVAKKTAIGLGVVIASLSSAEGNHEEKKQNMDSNLIEATDNNESNNIKNTTISFEEAKIESNYKGDYNENSNISKLVIDIKEKMDKKKENLSEENKILINNIKQLEKSIQTINEGKPCRIEKGSISILSSQDLNNLNNKTLENDQDVFTSPLDNRYITDAVSTNLFNTIPNLKLIDKNVETVESRNQLTNEGYIQTSSDFQQLIPEYYFVIEQGEQIDSNIKFTIKIISSENSTINMIEINEHMPEGNSLKDKILEDTVENVVIPNLVQKIQDTITTLQLNQN